MTIFDGLGLGGGGGGGGGGADALAALQAQFAHQAGDNPNLALLMQLFEQRQQAAAPGEPDVPSADEGLPPAAPVADPTPTLDAATSADLRLLLDRSAAIEAEVEVLRERNDALAAALGACHLCFGADDWCRHCGGRGTPGSLHPDRKAFDHYVRPALQRLARPPRPAPPRSRPRDSTDFGAVAGAPPGPDGLAQPRGG